MNILFEPISPKDRYSIIEIFNYYIENSFSAYPEKKMPYEFFDTLLKMSVGYPTVAAKNENGKVLGFGLLRPHSQIPTFSHTAEITYFITPEYTGRGIGRSMLTYLINEAQQRGIATILASISSMNEGSINFHTKNGFVECGRFQKICKKKGCSFDIVWMQLILSHV